MYIQPKVLEIACIGKRKKEKWKRANEKVKDLKAWKRLEVYKKEGRKSERGTKKRSRTRDWKKLEVEETTAK